MMFHHFDHSPEDWNEDWDRKILYLGPTTKSEEYSLEFIIKKNALRYTVSDPENIVELSKNLKKWKIK